MFKVCVVDDDDTIRHFLVSSLQQSGFNTSDYDSAEKLISNFNNESIDLIITDIQMEEISGIELLLYVKDKDPCIPVIAISGDGGYEDANGVNLDLLKGMTRSMGAETIIHKPINAHKLINLINKILFKTIH